MHIVTQLHMLSPATTSTVYKQISGHGNKLFTVCKFTVSIGPFYQLILLLYLDDGFSGWRQATLTLPNDVTIVAFTAVKGGQSALQPWGDIALDDIVISYRECT